MDQSNEIASGNQPLTSAGTDTQINAPIVPTEKLVPQSKVDEIVKSVKYETAQKARAEALDELKRSATVMPAGVGGMPAGVTQEQVREIIAQETQRQAQSMYESQAMNEANRIAQDFKSKLDAAKDSYPDFQETVNRLPFHSIAPVVGLANESANTAEIMYELGKNPSKIANLNSLAQINPELARIEMKRLSDSISINADAKRAKMPNAPLSQIPSSPISVDNGEMTTTDFRNMFPG